MNPFTPACTHAIHARYSGRGGTSSVRGAITSQRGSNSMPVASVKARRFSGRAALVYDSQS